MHTATCNVRDNSCASKQKVSIFLYSQLPTADATSIRYLSCAKHRPSCHFSLGSNLLLLGYMLDASMGQHHHCAAFGLHCSRTAGTAAGSLDE
jgi:hypothetical protein